MIGRRRRPPVELLDESMFAVRLDSDERAVISTLLGELEELLTDAEQGTTSPTVTRLFPPAFTDHEGVHVEENDEYERLMRTELVASRRAALRTVRTLLESQELGHIAMTAPELTAFMQSLNALRLTLGSILGVTDDDDDDNDLSDSPESVLFQWCGWMLEWVVSALSTTLPTEGGTLA